MAKHSLITPSIVNSLLINVVIAIILAAIFVIALHRADDKIFFYLMILIMVPGTQILALGLAIYTIGENKYTYDSQRHTNKLPFVIMMLLLLIPVVYRTFNGPPINKYFLPSPLQAQTTTLENLRTSMSKKVQYIKDHSGIFRPFNKNRNALLSQQIQKADLKGLAAINLLLSNNNAGLAPLEKLTIPLNTVGFQFEQGALGWYWYYGTFKTPEPVCYFIECSRTDLSNQDIRREMGLNIGETAMYTFGVGIGYQKKWYTPTEQTTFFGSYSSQAPGHMTLTPISLPNDMTFHVTFDGTTVNLVAGWDNNLVKATMQGVGLPSFNMPDGCAPCQDTGTLYWSYTNMKASADITIGGKKLPHLTDGDGWIDRQWGKGNFGRNHFGQYLQVVGQLTASPGMSLGKYVWINLHLHEKPGQPAEQFMIYQFLKQDEAKQVGDVIDCIYNRYSTELRHPEWFKKLNAKILQIDGIYPTKWEIDVPGRQKFVLDSTPFGTAVINEGISTAQHWNGSALIYPSNNPSDLSYGTGFLEMSEFQEGDYVLASRLKTAGITSTSDVDKFKGGEICFWQGFPSFYMFFYIVFLSVFLVTLIGTFVVGKLKI